MKKLIYVIHAIKHLSWNEMHYRVVFNKMSFNPIPCELKDLQKLEKKFDFQDNNIWKN